MCAKLSENPDACKFFFLFLHLSSLYCLFFSIRFRIFHANAYP